MPELNESFAGCMMDYNGNSIIIYLFTIHTSQRIHIPIERLGIAWPTNTDHCKRINEMKIYSLYQLTDNIQFDRITFDRNR